MSEHVKQLVTNYKRRGVQMLRDAVDGDHAAASWMAAVADEMTKMRGRGMIDEPVIQLNGWSRQELLVDEDEMNRIVRLWQKIGVVDPRHGVDEGVAVVEVYVDLDRLVEVAKRPSDVDLDATLPATAGHS